MKINQETDYAIRIMMRLCNSTGVSTGHDISDEMAIPLRFTLKILRKLSLCGLVKSQRGVNGGYITALSADQISLKSIIEAIEGPLYINKCLDPDAECNRITEKNECPIHNEFQKVNSLLHSAFDDITLDKFMTAAKT